MPILLSMMFIIIFTLLIFRDKVCLWIKDRVTLHYTPDKYGPPASRTPAPRVASQTFDENSHRIERLTSSYQNFPKRRTIEKYTLLLPKDHWMTDIEKDTTLNRTTCGHTTICENYGKEFCPMLKGDSCYDCVYLSIRISGYGSQVKGHFRQGRNGKCSWVKSHTRRI